MLQFEGWDQTQGSAGQLFDTSSTGGTTAFSTTSTTISIPVGQAPSWNAGAVLTPLLPGNYSTSDTTVPAGNSITSIFGSYFLDGNPDRPVAIAVAGVTSNGTWQFSLDNGSSWQNFAPIPSKTSAWLLSATDLVRFVPNTAAPGTASLTAYAWDNSAGTNGTAVNLTQLGVGGATAFSATTLAAKCAVNTSPTLTTTTIALTAVYENVNSPAITAATLLSSAGYADADGGTVPSGIAVTGDNGPGVWQWLKGSIWTALPSVSSASAFLLPGSAHLRFAPANNLPADTNNSATLSYLAWDETAGLADSLIALTTQGGATAFSTASATAAMPIDFVKQAPSWLLGQSASFTPVLGFSASNQTPSPAGDTVAAVFGSAFFATPGTAVGVAISAQTGTLFGGWQYFTDGGTTWQSFPTTLATNAVLLLSATDKIRFVPSNNFSGTVSLTAHAWDGTNGSDTQTVNLLQTGIGGASAFSATTLTATCRVNSAPTLPQ